MFDSKYVCLVLCLWLPVSVFVLKLINFMCTELGLYSAYFGVGCSLRTSREADNNQGHVLLRISVPGHGLCRSQTAVSGWAECFGHCASGSSYSHGKILKILICWCLYLYFGVLQSGFRIRIDLMRIRIRIHIQHFF